MSKRILRLTLKKEWFDLMATGIKNIEVRKPTKWIESRLFEKDGSERIYDEVLFINGYSNTAPRFHAPFLLTDTAYDFFELDFGEAKVDVQPGDYLIHIGEPFGFYNCLHLNLFS